MNNDPLIDWVYVLGMGAFLCFYVYGNGLTISNLYTPVVVIDFLTAVFLAIRGMASGDHGLTVAGCILVLASLGSITPGEPSFTDLVIAIVPGIIGVSTVIIRGARITLNR